MPPTDSQPTVTADTSAPPPRWPSWARVLAAPAIMYIGYSAIIAVLLIAQLTLPPKPIPAMAVRIVSQITYSLGVVGLLTLYLRYVERRRLSFVGLVFTRWTPLALLAGIAVSGVVQVVASLLLPGATSGPPDPLTGEGIPAWMLVVLAITQSFFLQGFPEELLFRGYVVNTLRSRPWLAITTSVLLFALIHLASNGGQEGIGERLLYLVEPFGFALSAVGLALVTRSLWAAVGVHTGNHLAWMTAAVFGVGEGPAMWVARGSLNAAVGVVLLIIWARRGPVIDYRY